MSNNPQEKPPLSPPVNTQAAAEATPTRGGTEQTTIAPTSNVTQKLRDAQMKLLKYDQESVKLTQEKYQAYLAMLNSANISGDQKSMDEAEKLKQEWEEATKQRTAGRQAIEKEIQEIINPALAEADEARKKRLQAIQAQSEKACLEKTNPKLARYKKPDLEKAIDQMGGQATQPFKESAKF